MTQSHGSKVELNHDRQTAEIAKSRKSVTAQSQASTIRRTLIKTDRLPER